MKQLYPNAMRNYALVSILKLITVSLLLTFSSVTFSQNLSFTSPVLESGTANLPGSVYRFSAVTASGQIDALVKIDSLIGVSLVNIDSTPTGSTAAFQPMISSPGGIGYHYAVFSFTFVRTGTTNPISISNFNTVFNSIDGNNQIEEFNSIQIGSASWQYLSATPDVAVTQNGDLITGTATSSNPSGGQSISLTDSVTMYQVTSLVTSGFIVRTGFYQKKVGWNGNDLFSMNFSGNEPEAITLPVNLLSFSVKQAKDKIALSWSVSQEVRLSHYVVERSYDYKNYDQAGIVFSPENPAAANNYTFQDPIRNKEAAVIYYRLRMVDKDGRYTFSDVKAVHMEKAGESVQIAAYPNPVLTDVRITIPQSWQQQPVTCQLINTSGLVVRSFTLQQAGQTATLRMSDMPIGTYIIKAASGNETSTRLIIKSK